MATKETKVISILVTEEQEEEIKNLFRTRNWNFQTVLHHSMSSQACGLAPEAEPPIASHQDDCDQECSFCFCAPCVTNLRYRQMWWPTRSLVPSVQNRGIRLGLYKKFWACLYNRHYWIEPRYQEKKISAMQEDPKLKNFVCHRRDIMPDCVVKRVRNWFPKTEKEHYVGHRWEN